MRAGMKLEPPRPNRPRTLTAESHHHASRPVSSPEGSAGARRFFHASDARSSNSPDPEPRTTTATKPAGKSSSPATFFYANGREERPPGDDSAKRRSTGPPTRSAASSKPPPPPSTSASPSPRFKLSNGANESGQLSDSLGPSVSPDDARESPSHRLSAPSSNFPERPPPVPLRRHIKSSSVDSGSSAISPREALRPSPNIVSPSDPQIPRIDTNVNGGGDGGNHNDAVSAAEAIQAILPRLFSNMSNGSGDTHASASPVKSDTASQSTNDPAASARVGRKIMDLEISNSSLLAINRTLEREMRKQNAELRRFRRLSRAGHFSATPARSASGPTLDTTHEVDEGSSEISNTQSTDDLSDISDEEDDDEGDSTDEGVMSPGSLAEHDAKHRVSDEKHVFTDLAKHQELLVDSQKMNQSLRRCLGWTEELIREGQKALEYNVHVNDVELGGRVLAPEELLDIGESARGLLSSSAASDYKSDMSSTASYDMDDSASVSTATDTA